MLHFFFRTMDGNIRDLDCESLTSLIAVGKHLEAGRSYPSTNFCYGKTLRSYFALRKCT